MSFVISKQRKSRTKALTRMGVSLSALFLFFLFSLSYVSAAHIVIQTGDITEGLEINYPKIFTIKQNENITFRTIPVNKSNGVRLDNTTANCVFILTNDDGTYIYSENMTYNSHSFILNVSGSTFSKLGQYAYGIHCETKDGSYGGFASVAFEVTPSGEGGNEYLVFSTFVILLIYAITFIAFFYARNIPLTVIGGMAMIFLGVYIVRNGIIIFRDTLTNYISYVTIGTGFMLAMWALLEQFDVI